MSVAFTKEGDAESVAADLPDRPISSHPNLVTPSGLALLNEALAQARSAYAAARSAGDGVSADRTAMARATRDLRYYAARRGSAQLVEPSNEIGVARFGSTVTLDRADGRRQMFRIVGEDEANPAAGAISYISPLAQALMGRGISDEVQVAGGDAEIITIA
jgi:transcription elongation GreA/GreB family factor